MPYIGFYKFDLILIFVW